MHAFFIEKCSASRHGLILHKLVYFPLRKNSTMKNNLRISLLQWSLYWHQAEKNLCKFKQLADNHPGSDLYLLPEMFTTGFTMKPKEVAEPMDGPTIEALRKLSSEMRAWILGSVVIRVGQQHFNRMIASGPDGQLLHYDKRHLFSFAGENQHYTAGNQRLSLEIQGWRVNLQICYDLRFPVWSRNTDGSQLIIYVANWPASRSSAWKSLLSARAIENQCYVAGVNRIGEDANQLSYSGDTRLIDFNGTLLIDLGQDEAIGTTLLSAEDLNSFRSKFPFLKDRDQFKFII